jgi:hypothetical protein
MAGFAYAFFHDAVAVFGRQLRFALLYQQVAVALHNLSLCNDSFLCTCIFVHTATVKAIIVSLPRRRN